MEKLRIGIIGTGLIGRQHAESVARIPGTELVAICEPNPGLMQRQSEYLGVSGYTDYREMIDTEKPDVIHNCTPNNLHFEISKYALEMGLHVYSEKPLAVTVGQGEELTALAAAKGLANGVNFNYRNNAMVQEMRSRFTRGDAGRCLLIHGHYIQDWLLYREDYNWRVDSAAGGGSRAIADIGSHWFDTVQTITGRKITAVYAHNFRSFDKRGPAAEHEVNTEDGSFILVEMEGGIRGSVIVSQVSAGYKNHLDISIDCEKYSMRWNQEQSDRLVIGTRNEGVKQIYAAPDSVDASVSRYATLPSGHPVGWADAFTNGIREFYRDLASGTYKTGNHTYSDFANATYIMKIVDACMRSDKTGNWEKV